MELKRERKVPYKTIMVVLIIGIMFYGLYKAFSYIFKTREISRQQRIERFQNEEKKKLEVVKEKKFDLLCEKKVVNKSVYTLVKIDNILYVINGNKFNNIEESYRLTDCDVIYIVDK